MKRRPFAVMLLVLCMLVSLMPMTALAADSGFKDVPADAWYADALAWAVEAGITTGNGDGGFGPAATCTRAHAVTFLWRAAGEPAPENEKSSFKDVRKNAYYHDAVLWAAEQGITEGYADGDMDIADQ